MAKEYKTSAEQLDAWKEELHYLNTEGVKDVAEKIKEARSFGDLSENSEYDEAKNEQSRLYARIAELQDLVANAVVVEKTHRDGIHMGSIVTVKDLEFGDEETYTIVGSQEADPLNGTISEESPIGKALLKAGKAGEEIVVEAPEGNIKYLILGIENKK